MDKSLAFQASPRILLLHSILGVGTNCFPMRIEKLPTLASLLSETEMLHIEAFPAVLRLLVRGPLIDELERIADEGKEIEKISFYRVALTPSYHHHVHIPQRALSACAGDR